MKTVRIESNTFANLNIKPWKENSEVVETTAFINDIQVEDNIATETNERIEMSFSDAAGVENNSIRMDIRLQAQNSNPGIVIMFLFYLLVLWWALYIT